MDRKFTVIIPTRERADTLVHSIKTCIAQEYDQLEILVCDNASQDHTKDVVHSFNDSRIRYINPGHRVSMMENFEFAFSHVQNGYVISMGDDDGLTRNSVQKANQMLADSRCEAIVSDFAHYMWPNVKTDSANQLLFSTKTGYEVRSSKQSLKAVLYGRHPFNHVPCIYYGYLNSEILNRLRQKHGKLFLTNIVDVFSSVAVSLSLPQYCFSFEPLAINGTSNHSNGASFLKVTKDDTEKNRWFSENTTTSLASFTTSPSIKMMLAEACHALIVNNSDLLKQGEVDFKVLFSQALQDVRLYPKSDIDPMAIKKTANALQVEIREASTWQIFLATIELYAQRLPKFFQSSIVDVSLMSVHDVNAAAASLQAMCSYAQQAKLSSKFDLLKSRFLTVRK